MSDIDEKKNSFRVRQLPPGQFTRFRVQPFPKSQGVQMVVGIKPDGGSEIQSLIFSKDKFSNADSVKAWIGTHENSKLAEIEIGSVEKFTDGTDFYGDITPIGKDFKKVFIARETDLKFRRGITKNDIEQIKKNFDNDVIGRKVDFDYSHKEDPAKGFKAAGVLLDTVIEDMEIKGKKFKSLWGTPQWTPLAEKAIAEGEYYGISPEIRFGFIHPETGVNHGTTLKSVAILNNQQIPNQPDIELHKAQNNNKKEETMDKLKELLESKDVKFSDDEVTEEILVAKFTEMFKTKDAEIKKISEDKKASDKKLKETETKLKETTDTMSDKDTKFTELSETVKTMKETKASEDIQKLCELAVGAVDGKLKVKPEGANFKEKTGWFYEMFKGNTEAGHKYLEDMPVIVVNAKSHSDGNDEGEDTSDSDKLHEEVKAEMTKFASENGGKTLKYTEAFERVQERKSEEGGDE